MPQKVPFKVIHSSGQDDLHSASELSQHSPTSSGWHSSKYCIYPQDIVLQLDYKVRLKKIQILSHQYLIPTKVEFYIGDISETDMTHPDNVKYTRLGYVGFSNNEKTNFKARELKSVHIDAFGQFLKLVIHKNYINSHNLYNQVGMIAINVIGTTVDELQQHEKASEDPDLAKVFGKADYVSPLDDLAFDMYQDPEVAQIIRRLERRKKEAVIHENFAHAKKLKQAIDELQKVGEKLGKYELEKRLAIENEDYDTAQEKKSQMDNYRVQIYKQLQLHNLLDPGRLHSEKFFSVDDIQRMANESMPLEASPHKAVPIEHKGEVMASKKEPGARPPSPPTRLHDEQVVPTLRNRSRQHLPEDPVELTPRKPDVGGGGDAAAEAPPLADSSSPVPEAQLTEKELRDAQPLVDVFGMEWLNRTFSKNWTHRESVVTHICEQLRQKDSQEDAHATLRACVFLIKKLMPDKVFGVFKAALRLIDTTFSDFITESKVSKIDAQTALERILPPVFVRLGDSNIRARDMVRTCLIDLARKPGVQSVNFIAGELTRPIKTNVAARLAQNRFLVVEALYKADGLQYGLTVDGLMQFCLQGLEHPAGEVREVAERLIIDLYPTGKERVRGFLPPDDPKTRKITKYRLIFDAFDKIDGKSENSEVDEAQEAKKQAEIDTLQTELKQLRDLAAEKESRRAPREAAEDAAAAADIQEAKEKDEEVTLEALDKMCIFCGEKDNSFDEQGLDVHYWKACPMLRRCAHCKQVVEIQSLSDHLVTECEAKADFSRCPECGEAIPVAELNNHVGSENCFPPGNNQIHCSLCNTNINGGEKDFQEHLISANGCKNNPRRIQALNRKAKGTGRAIVKPKKIKR